MQLIVKIFNGAILLIFLSLFVISCEKSTASSSDNNKFKGIFYRIQAEYEVVSTREIISFDFIVSCYNRDVPGSFHGIIKPTIMYKSTNAGAAVAISPPEHYCQRGLRGLALEKKSDAMKMPVLSWYPSVEDLSFAYVYMTNDAYMRDEAEVRFRTYSVTRSDQESFTKWRDLAEDTYKQVGAIPGPFGCGTANITSKSEYSCSYPKTIERNNGYNLVAADDGTSIAHAFVYPMVQTESIQTVKDFVEHQGQFYCPAPWYFTADGKVEGKLMPLTKDTISDSLELFVRDNYGQRKKRKYSGNYIYLDPQKFSTNSDLQGSQSIEEVYPVWKFRIDGAEVKYISRLPQFKGLAVVSHKSLSADELGFKITHSVSKENAGIAIVDEKLACLNAYSANSFTIYDFSQQLVISTNYHY